MKILFSFLFTLLFIQIFGQDTLKVVLDTNIVPSVITPIPVTIGDVIENFVTVFNVAVALIFFVANIVVQKIPAIAKIADAKIIAAVLATVAAIIAVLIKGVGALESVPAVIGTVWYLYNLVKGWIDSHQGDTIAAKTEMAAAANRAAYK